MSPPVTPVLMSGGRGSRLWPLSRRDHPKQLQPLLGTGTMLQATAMRLAGVPGVTPPIVVCGFAQTELVGEQLAEIGCEPMVTVAEPVGRNTAPAIAAAALVAPADSILVVLPADHVVADLESFREAVSVAVKAADDGGIVTFGVVPTRAETGYGYIEAVGDGSVRRIAEFLEKPDAETAGRFVGGGRHFWNSGMFVFRPDVVLAELRRHAGGVVDAVERSLASTSGDVRRPGPEFAGALSIPFDVAVMEKTDLGVMVPLEAGWDDVGSWRSLWEVSERDSNENVGVGDVVLRDVHRSYVRADDRPVVVLGLEDVAVVDAGDVVFVASMRHAQRVRELVEFLDRERPELT
jgi:mannose-1-phosphate guanylyltransferase / mannose-6-phosphate isomerase